MRIKLFVVYAALSMAVAPTAAFSVALAQGLDAGGALGTSAARPGTNSLGTALPDQVVKSGHGGMKGVMIGTTPAIARRNKKVQWDVEHSICRGC